MTTLRYPNRRAVLGGALAAAALPLAAHGQKDGIQRAKCPVTSGSG